MTPERGIELLQRGQDENGRVDVFEALSVVLAATAEERRAALTEAANLPRHWASEDEQLARVLVSDILALRDRGPR